MPQPEYLPLMQVGGLLQEAQLLLVQYVKTVPQDVAPLEQAAMAIEVIGFVVNEAEREARDFASRGLSAA